MMIASFETTAHTFCATLYLLAKTPEWQSVFLSADNKEPVRLIVKESLRLLPPVLQMTRTSQFNSKVGSLSCPFRTKMVVDVVAMHRSKEHWGADADDFDPARWTRLAASSRSIGDGEEEGDGALANRWVPFGMGNKSCIGQSLALQVLETMLGDFVRTFHVSVEEGYTPQFAQTPTLRFTNGLKLHLHHRTIKTN
jgi:cytochrome P450